MGESRYPTPVEPGRTRIGWIGTGIMGSAMAYRILSAGYPLSVFARNPAGAASLVSAGAHLAASPADLALSSDVIFTMLSHPSDVRSVVLDSLLSHPAETLNNLVLVDSTSSEPALAAEISAAARSKNCFSIDAPVSGGDSGAKNGKLAIFAGGDSATVEWLSSLFDILGRVTYMGPAGAGQSAKIANQIVVSGSLLGLSESMLFAEEAGLDVDRFLDAVRRGGAGSMAMEIFGERVARRELGPGGFAEYLVKDLGMALDGRNATAALPGAALCRQMYMAMVANGDGKMGTHGLISVLERINGKKKKQQQQEEKD